MNKQQNKNKINLRWALTIGLALIVFAFWRFAYPEALAYHEEMQLFLWNGDYFLERLAEPGGMARYFAELLVQYYNNLLVGALILALLMVLLQQATWLLMRWQGCENTMKNELGAYLTPIIIWCMMGDKNVMLTFPIAVLLTLGMVAIASGKFTSASSKFIQSVIFSFLMATLGYWIVGPMAIWGALLMVIIAMIKEEDKWRIVVLGIGTMIVGVFTLLLSAHLQPYPLSQVVRGIDYYREPTQFFPHEWYTSDVYEQLEYSLLVRRQDWNGILAKAAKRSPAATASEAAVKLAEWKTGSLSNEDMRRFVASYAKLDNPINICMKSDVYFQMGLVNASRRYAFEFKQLIGNANQSGRILKRLAETELVSGHEVLARKYLYILQDATFYRQWAEKTLPLTYSKKLLMAHPVYGPLTQSFPKDDVIF